MRFLFAIRNGLHYNVGADYFFVKNNDWCQFSLLGYIPFSFCFGKPFFIQKPGIRLPHSTAFGAGLRLAAVQGLQLGHLLGLFVCLCLFGFRLLLAQFLMQLLLGRQFASPPLVDLLPQALLFLFRSGSRRSFLARLFRAAACTQPQIPAYFQ